MGDKAAAEDEATPEDKAAAEDEAVPEDKAAAEDEAAPEYKRAAKDEAVPSKSFETISTHNSNGIPNSIKFLIGLISSAGVVSLIMMLNAVFKQKIYRFESEELPTVEYEEDADKFFLSCESL